MAHICIASRDQDNGFNVQMKEHLKMVTFNMHLILTSHMRQSSTMKAEQKNTIHTKNMQQQRKKIIETFISQCIIMYKSRWIFHFPNPHLYHCARNWKARVRQWAAFTRWGIVWTIVSVRSLFCIIIFNFIGKLTAYYTQSVWGWGWKALPSWLSIHSFTRLIQPSPPFLSHPHTHFSYIFIDLRCHSAKISMVVNHWISFLQECFIQSEKSLFIILSLQSSTKK